MGKINPFEDDSLLDVPDDDQKEDINLALNKLLEKAKLENMSKIQHEKLAAIIYNNKTTFRVGMCLGPPAKILPMLVQLSTNAKPVRVKLRN